MTTLDILIAAQADVLSAFGISNDATVDALLTSALARLRKVYTAVKDAEVV